MAWIDPSFQDQVDFRPSDLVISVPGKSGTTWSMNIFHQIRSRGDPTFEDIYVEVPWLEFLEYPGQKPEELLERWRAIPGDRRRGFKTHAAPGHCLTFRDDVKYLVVARNPLEAAVSMYPFFMSLNREFADFWGSPSPQLHSFPEFWDAIFSKPYPAHAPPEEQVPTMVHRFVNFVNGWWPHRKKPNVLMMHFSDMVKDHEISIRKIAVFLDEHPTEEQWPKIMEYSSFPWMKANGVKFEIPKVSKFKVISEGGMVRKGQVGTASEDGMTPEIKSAILDIFAQGVPDAEARRWMFEGGGFSLDEPAAA